MENAASVLASLFKNIGMEDRLTLVRLQKEWCALFEVPLSSHTYPASLNSGILVVNVDSPPWMQQLKYFKQAMLKKLGTYKIKAIDFRHGKIRHFTGDHAAADSSEKPGKRKELTDADADWIEQTVATIDDPELQDTIRKALQKALLNPK